MAIINFNSISGISSITATNSVTVGSGSTSITIAPSGISGVSSITVGSAFIQNNVVGLGTTTTAGRNAGVGTAVGSLIYNETLGVLEIYKRNSGWVAIGTAGDDSTFGAPLGLTATGGVVSDYTDPGPGSVYRAHIFTSTGTFTVSALSPTYPATVQYLVVGGGGGGGSAGGGGGAGGFRTNVPGTTHSTAVDFSIPASLPAPFSVTIGAGGVGSVGGGIGGGTGGPSSFGPITSTGGGGGGTGSATPATGGGSGGGVGRDVPNGTSGGSTTSVTTPSPWPGPSTQGFAGGGISGLPTPVGGYTGAGGGGAGGAGQNGGRYDISNPATYSLGGDGLPLSITGITTHYAGGGGGGQYPGPTIPRTNTRSGGLGGGGAGGCSDGSAPEVAAIPGSYATGSGGGGGGGPSGGYSGAGGIGGNGGSGIVVVRYQIGKLAAAAKATGGSISYYNNKTIHTFTSSGTFATAPNWTATNVEYVVLGGGGGGGGDAGGGGGAGGYLTGTTPIGAHPVSTTIQVGAGAAFPGSPGDRGGNGTPSYFGTPITGYGGGGGGGGGTPPGTGAASSGGSGGGNRGNRSGSTTPAPSPYTPQQGYAGGVGNAPGVSPIYSGGGGGAGGAGEGSSGGPSNGGIGVQLPATFRNPVSQPSPTGGGLGMPGPGGGYYWVGGGGGGVRITSTSGVGGGPGGPYAGGGNAAQPDNVSPDNSTPGAQNTGGGGGGATQGPPSTYLGTNGGSGIVLIAYPS
jgi:hypothetical protein